MLSQRRIATIRSLHRKKERQRQKLFLVEGMKPVSALLDSAENVRFVMGLKERIDELKVEQEKGPEFQECDRSTFESCSSLDHPEGILAVAEMPVYSFDPASLRKDRPLLCLEGLRDPGNLGTILRIADHFDLQDLLLASDSVDPFNPKAVRGSMGSIFRQRVHKLELKSTVQRLKEEGRRVIAADMEGPSIYSHPVPADAVLLMGNESHGLSDGLKGAADETRSLPALGQVESLNVAVSAGIFCSEILRECF